MSDQPVLIAGGGIAGLAAAIALAEVGIASRVLERRSEFSEVGAGIQIGPNGTHVLRRLALFDRLAPAVGVPQAIVVRDGRDGSELSRLPLGDWIASRHGAPYWTVHRADLHAALLERARAIAAIDIVTGFEVASMADGPDAIRVQAADGRTADGRFLVGADGIGSRVRQAAIADTSMTAAGRVAARTVVAVTPDMPPDAASCVSLWLAPGAHVVHYPVKGGREIAIVIISREPMKTEGWATPVAAATVLARIGRLPPGLRRFLAGATDWRQWMLLEAPPLPRWHSGRTLLVGDATGPFFPFLAQGAVMALEDAAALATLLARSSNHLPAFTAFEAARRPRRQRMIDTAARNGRIYHLSGPMALARNLTMRLTPPERIMAGYDWLYGHRA